MIDQLAHHKVQLQIRRGLAGLALDEPTGFSKIRGQRAFAVAAPLENSFQRLHRAAE